MKDLIFAYRLSGGASIGGNRQNFFIGGTEGWINNRFKNDSIPVVNVEDYAFLTPVLPLRGYEYNAENGSYFAVANMELRFPLIRSLVFGGLPIGFSNILGTTFVDIGSAWTNSQSWKGFGSDTSGATVTKDLLIGTGFGIRMGIFGLPLRFDVAWKFQWSKFSDPFYYISLGADY
jgi:outer membrane protein assembly factor BamA